MSQPFPTADLPWSRVRPVEVVFVVLEVLCVLGSLYLWYDADRSSDLPGGEFAFIGVVFAWACLALFVPALVCTVVGLLTRRGGPLFAGKLLTMLGICGGPFVLVLGAFLFLGTVLG